MTPDGAFQLNTDLFARLTALLAATAGLEFGPDRRGSLEIHIAERARARHCASAAEYVALLSRPAGGREELQQLIELVTIHETSFFRNHEHFRALREHVLPSLARQRAAERRLRLWSAGCSTGEEPYSLAIACLEQPTLAGWTITIEATDLSGRVLAQARLGQYRPGALRYVEPARVARWFTTRTGDRPAPVVDTRPLGASRATHTVAEEARRLVRFRPLNLAQPPYPDDLRDFDLIVCENVLIYLQPPVVRRVVDELYERLAPGGFLFLGYSETLWQISDRFDLITRPRTFFYQAPLGARPPAAVSPPPPAGVPAPARPRRETTPLRPPAPTPPAPPPAPRAPARPAPGAGIAQAEALARQGQADEEAGRYAAAQTAYEAALRSNPSDVAALLGEARMAANQGRLGEAAAAVARVLDVDALNEEAHLLGALVARQEGRPADALDHLEKVIYIDPESIAGHYQLAELHRAAGQRAEAAREYRRALWALGRHPEVLTISGLPATMIRHACEQQLRRLPG